MNRLMQGAVVMGCAIIGLFFLKFWKKSRDRLFLFFSAAFWVMGLDWTTLALINTDEPHTTLYFVRLIAFTLIVVGIWDKNRSRSLDAAATPPDASG